MREVLRKGLQAVREYEASQEELGEIMHKLGLVQNARNSLRELSEESRAAAGVKMDVLDRQIADLERQTKNVDGKEVRGWGEKARRAGQEPRTEPSPDTGGLVENAQITVTTTNRERPSICIGWRVRRKARGPAAYESEPAPYESQHQDHSSQPQDHSGTDVTHVADGTTTAVVGSDPNCPPC
ncbi:MAG: hypothetical protein GEV11_23640 [Streptosporangiales bacterium]|nr:hypothetical protein [Streptosporangiales bacterium]